MHIGLAYARGIGRPFHYETDDGQRLTIEPPPKANAYGLGIIGLSVDLGTGSGYDFDPDEVNVALAPIARE